MGRFLDAIKDRIVTNILEPVPSPCQPHVLELGNQKISMPSQGSSTRQTCWCPETWLAEAVKCKR
jgi:hypothetical protein